MDNRECEIVRDRCEHLIAQTLRSLVSLRHQAVDCLADNADAPGDLMSALLHDLADAQDSQQRLLALLVTARNDLSTEIAAHANAARTA